MSRELFDSRIPWIGIIPSSWEIKRVKQAFTYKKSKARQDNPVILSLARNGIRERDISNNEGQIAASYFDYNPVDIGDFLLNPMDLYSGANCNVATIAGVISPAYANLRFKPGINPFYFDYYFKIQYWHMAMFAHGKGVSFDHRWTLNRSDLMNYFVPIPSLSEQTKIVETLQTKTSQVDQLIELQEQQIEKLKEYKQSVISKAVTKGLDPNATMKDSGIEWIGKMPAHWEVNKLKYITNFRETKNNNINLKYIALENIESYSGRWIDSDAEYDPNQARTCFPGDVLFGKLRPYLTKAFYIEKEACCSSEFLVMDNPSKTRYLLYLVLSYGFIDVINSSTYGTKMPRANSTFIGSIFCPVLPKNEEEQISAYLDEKCGKIDTKTAMHLRKISKLQEYKKSLIFEYVTGKREVND